MPGLNKLVEEPPGELQGIAGHSTGELWHWTFACVWWGPPWSSAPVTCQRAGDTEGEYYMQLGGLASPAGPPPPERTMSWFPFNSALALGQGGLGARGEKSPSHPLPLPAPAPRGPHAKKAAILHYWLESLFLEQHNFLTRGQTQQPLRINHPQKERLCVGVFFYYFSLHFQSIFLSVFPPYLVVY